MKIIVQQLRSCRRNVIDMLRRQSESDSSSPSTQPSSSSSFGAQFIFTAHKKEMVERAQCLFRVRMVNNQSRITASNLQEAAKYFVKRAKQQKQRPDKEESRVSNGSSQSSDRLPRGGQAAVASPSSMSESSSAADSSPPFAASPRLGHG